MTSEQKTLAIWGGGAGAFALIGLIWVLVRGGTLADEQARVAQLQTDYSQAQPSGAKLENQIKALEKAAQEQGIALTEAAKVLVPELKPEYRAADLTSAANRVATDLKALRQRAERTRVSLPSSLPLESGLDPDEYNRQQQLAQLELYRAALDLLMDAGVAKISAVTPGKSWTDPSGTYAIFTADIDCEAPFVGMQAVLEGFLTAHAQGLGLRNLTLAPTSNRSDANVRGRLTASLIVPAKAEWKLAPDRSLPAAKPVKSTAPGAASTPSASAAAPKPATTTASSKPSLGDD
jgi:hypothetical protein